ncbi:ribosome recycling factor [Weissella beninensis]|uniref:Ribosome-recycling factor n=1 Tax=Periweissella beninensis TaxID=504936 RepID=A0ABT0VFR9_9LACO|nr:ribosome recycling factor [Periweissella beninensis]MBM7543564.1 ribosome recycling factor [Periweissella beninensis]MCM2436546.1 ribosome recycling factor [Periweissella beninensis]
MVNAIINDAKERMEKAGEALQRELQNIRAGRANVSILNRVEADYYGVMTPINQMAAIQIPEARVLLITPYDKSSLDAIEHAIYASDLGLTPSNDGSAIRLVIPQLTEERRKELAKEVKGQAENAKVAVRNIRRDAMDTLKKQQKASDITEDELRHLEEQVQKATDVATKNVDAIAKVKEEELLTI